MNNNVRYIRLILLLLLIVFSGEMKGQSKDVYSENENYCLFGYISENPDEFNEVVNYLNGTGVKVLNTCEDEFLIYVILNQDYKEYSELFKRIEKKFTGTCYFKSQENRIPRYVKCREKYLKETENNQ